MNQAIKSRPMTAEERIYARRNLLRQTEAEAYAQGVSDGAAAEQEGKLATLLSGIVTGIVGTALVIAAYHAIAALLS